jgi:hypothetical protein
MLNIAQQQTTDDHIFLTGRPPMTEYLSFVLANTAKGNQADRAGLAQAWRAANDHLKALEAEEVGWADETPVLPVPEHLHELADAALQDPSLQQSYALLPVAIQMVELDRLVVYQKAINLGQVARIKSRLGTGPSDEDVFRVCFPLDRSFDPPWGAQQGANGWTFVSPSNDFRVLGVNAVHPSQVMGDHVQGSPVAVMTIAVGYGINLLAAARIEGRLILTNGSHRAYALRDAGITHVPCLVQELTRREELDLLGVEELTTSPDSYLTAPRPPLLKDYFDPKLLTTGEVQRKDRHVQIAISVNPMDLPAPPRE